MDNTTEILVAEAQLGREAEKFFESDLGRYIEGAVKQEVQAATDALISVDPNDTQEIIRLQNKIRTAEAGVGYLKELIIKGVQAIQIIESRED